MELAELLQVFAENVGLEAVKSDAAGTYWLMIDQFTVGFTQGERDRSVVIHTAIAPRNEASAAQVAELLLQLNLRHLITAGGSLALDPEAGSYVYQWREALDALDLDRFRSVLETFANEAENLSQTILNFSGEVPTDERPAGAFAREEEPVPSPLGMRHFIQV